MTIDNSKLTILLYDNYKKILYLDMLQQFSSNACLNETIGKTKTVHIYSSIILAPTSSVVIPSENVILSLNSWMLNDLDNGQAEAGPSKKKLKLF